MLTQTTENGEKIKPTVLGARLFRTEGGSDSLRGGSGLRCGKGQQGREGNDAKLHDESGD